MWEVRTPRQRPRGLPFLSLCVWLLASSRVPAVTPLPSEQRAETSRDTSAVQHPSKGQQHFPSLAGRDPAEGASGRQGRVGAIPSAVLSLKDIFSMHKRHRPALFEGSLETDNVLSDNPDSLKVYIRMTPEDVAEIVTSVHSQARSSQTAFPPSGSSPARQPRTFSLLSSAIPPLASFSRSDPPSVAKGFDLRIDVVASAPPLVYTRLSSPTPFADKLRGAPRDGDTARHEEELETSDSRFKRDYSAASVCTWLNRRRLCEQDHLFTTSFVVPLSISHLPSRLDATGERPKPQERLEEEDPGVRTSGFSGKENTEDDVQDTEAATPASILLRLLRRDEIGVVAGAADEKVGGSVFLPETKFSLCEGTAAAVENRREASTDDSSCQDRLLSLAITLPFLPPTDPQERMQPSHDVQHCTSSSSSPSSLDRERKEEERDSDFLSALNDSFKESALAGASSPQRVLLLVSLQAKGGKTSDRGLDAPGSFSPMKSAKSFFSTWKFLPPNALQSADQTSHHTSVPFGCSSIEMNATLLGRLVSDGDAEKTQRRAELSPQQPFDHVHGQDGVLKELSEVSVTLPVEDGWKSFVDIAVRPGPLGVSLLHVDLKEKKRGSGLFVPSEVEAATEEDTRSDAAVGDRPTRKAMQDRVGDNEDRQAQTGEKEGEGLAFLEVEEANTEDLPTVLICPAARGCSHIAAYRPSSVFLPLPEILRQSYQASLAEYQRNDRREPSSPSASVRRWILPLFVKRSPGTQQQQQQQERPRTSHGFVGGDFSLSSFLWGGDEERKEKAEEEEKRREREVNWFQEGAHVLLLFPQKMRGITENIPIRMRVGLLPRNQFPPAAFAPDDPSLTDRHYENRPSASGADDRNSLPPSLEFSPSSLLPSPSPPPPVSAPSSEPAALPFSFPSSLKPPGPASHTPSSPPVASAPSSFSPAPLGAPPFPSTSPSSLPALFQPLSSPSSSMLLPSSPSSAGLRSPSAAVSSVPAPSAPSASVPSSLVPSSSPPQSLEASSLPASSVPPSPSSSSSSELPSWASAPLSFLPSAPQSTSASSVCLFLLLLLVISAVAMLTAVKLAMYMDTATRTRPVPEEASPPSSSCHPAILENPSTTGDLESSFFSASFPPAGTSAAAPVQSSVRSSARTPPFFSSPFSSHRATTPLIETSEDHVLHCLEETPFGGFKSCSSTAASSSDFFSMDFSHSLPQTLSRTVLPTCFRRGLGPSTLPQPQGERRGNFLPPVSSSASQPHCDSSGRGEAVEKAEEQAFYARRMQRRYQTGTNQSEADDDDDLVRSFSGHTRRRLSSPTGCSMLLELQEHQRNAEEKSLLKERKEPKGAASFLDDLFSLGSGRPTTGGNSTRATDEDDVFWSDRTSSPRAALVHRRDHGGGVRTPKRDTRHPKKEQTERPQEEEKTGKQSSFSNDHYVSACSTRAESLLPQQTTGVGGEEENTFWFSSASGTRRSTGGSSLALSNALLADPRNSERTTTAEHSRFVDTEDRFSSKKIGDDLDQDVFFRGQPPADPGVSAGAMEPFAFFEDDRSSSLLHGVHGTDADLDVSGVQGQGSGRHGGDVREEEDRKTESGAGLSISAPGLFEPCKITQKGGEGGLFAEAGSGGTYDERCHSSYNSVVKQEEHGRMNEREQEDFEVFGRFRRAGDEDVTDAFENDSENLTQEGQDTKGIRDSKHNNAEVFFTGDFGQPREEDFHPSCSEDDAVENIRKTSRKGSLVADDKDNAGRLLGSPKAGGVMDDRQMFYVCPRSGLVDPLAPPASENPYQVSYRVGDYLEAVETTEGDAEDDSEPPEDVRKATLLACFPEGV